MSLPRIAFKPFAQLSAAPSRAFSSTCVAFQSSRPSYSGPRKTTDSNNFSAQDAQGRSNTEYMQTLAHRASINEQVDTVSQHKNMANFLTRLGRWKVGDIYAPHDLTGAETSKWRKRGSVTPTTDAFDTLALDPLKEYKNFSIMASYMSEYGRIKHRKSTGLKPKNQRRLAKAIRRAIGLGIMPSVHAHPESINKTSNVVIEDTRIG